MTRKKVKLAFIAIDLARKTTYKKRMKGMIKKVNELSTLCGIDDCVIIYSPYESHAEVWSFSLGVQRVLAQFKRMPEMEQSKKMVNQESFLREKINKAREQLKKLNIENREKEISHVMYQSLVGNGLDHLSMMDLNDLGWMIDQKLKDINNMIGALKQGVFSSFVTTPSRIIDGVARTGGLLLNAQYEEESTVAIIYDPNAESSMRKQWLMDIVNFNDKMDDLKLGSADKIMPFADINNNNGNNGTNNNGFGLWSNAAFFPWEN